MALKHKVQMVLTRIFKTMKKQPLLRCKEKEDLVSSALLLLHRRLLLLGPKNLLLDTSKTAWLKHGASCSAGDVVLVASAGSSKWACGKIHLHLAFAGQCFALMSLFSLLEVGKSFAIWQDSAGDSEISAVAMRDILTPLVYNSSAGKVTTLIPLPWR